MHHHKCKPNVGNPIPLLYFPQPSDEPQQIRLTPDVITLTPYGPDVIVTLPVYRPETTSIIPQNYDKIIQNGDSK